MNVVIYHADCYDGFTAAWIVNRHFDGKVKMIPAKYGQEPPWKDIEDKNVWVVDFSYPREKLMLMNQVACNLVVLDHHKTAKDGLDGLPFCEFDMNRSGAGMTWDHFYCADRPNLVKAVEDRDLWSFSYPFTKDYHAHMSSLPMTLEAWDEMNDSPLGQIIDSGSSIRRYIQRYCEMMSVDVPHMHFAGFDVGVVNAPYVNCSELLNHILEECDGYDIAMSYFKNSDGKWQYSLRSRRGGPDVSAIAKLYGGGGHVNASGFSSHYLLSELR